jgi:hypothetical protein
MNVEMAYLIGMILGNGEIQQGKNETTVTIEIPHKNLYTDDEKDVQVYVKASLMDIRQILEPLLGTNLICTQNNSSTKMTFSKPNAEHVMRQILHFVGGGSKHLYMKMSDDIFSISKNEKKSMLRGFADVTGYIRKSNIAFGQEGAYRVYIEIPANWQMTIDLANLLKEVEVPVQNIDFGHPNFRDSHLKKYNEGKRLYWKKEHQIKIFANEFLAIGFNVSHKQDALEKYSKELLLNLNPESTHKFYWEKKSRTTKLKPFHPGENDSSLPSLIRGKHYNSWTELSKDLGYGK